MADFDPNEPRFFTDETKQVQILGIKARQRFDSTRRAWKLTDHYRIDCSPDSERTLDRRLVLAAAGGMDALQARWDARGAQLR